VVPISSQLLVRKSAAAAIAVSFAIAGCSGHGDNATSTGAGGSAGAGGAAGQGGAGGSASATALCSAVDPYCEALFACCANPPFGYTSVDDCKTKFAMYCSTEIAPFVDGQINAGSTVLEPMALDACITTLAAMKPGGTACSAPPDLVFWYDCFGAFHGQIPPGGTCLAQGDFPSFIYCKDGLCPGGQCVAFFATGASCQPADACNLIAGDWCINGTCAKGGNVGAPCSPPSSDDNLQCKSMSCGPSGTCIPPTPVGLCSQL
jgi:hypothetical protein